MKYHESFILNQSSAIVRNIIPVMVPFKDFYIVRHEFIPVKWYIRASSSLTLSTLMERRILCMAYSLSNSSIVHYAPQITTIISNCRFSQTTTSAKFEIVKLHNLHMLSLHLFQPLKNKLGKNRTIGKFGKSYEKLSSIFFWVFIYVSFFITLDLIEPNTRL